MGWAGVGGVRWGKAGQGGWVRGVWFAGSCGRQGREQLPLYPTMLHHTPAVPPPLDLRTHRRYTQPYSGYTPGRMRRGNSSHLMMGRAQNMRSSRPR